MLPLLRTTIVKRRTSPVVTSPAFRSFTDLVEMVKFGDAVMFVVAVLGFTAAVWVLVVEAGVVVEVGPAGGGGCAVSRGGSVGAGRAAAAPVVRHRRGG